MRTIQYKYTRLSLSRISAYLKMKLYSLFSYVNLTTDNKIFWPLLRSNFSSLPQYFQYISNFRSQITYLFVKCACSIYFFLNSANLICRVTDISNHFRESLGLRDGESRLAIPALFLSLITKTRLFKYIENFTSKNKKNIR